MRTQEVLVVWVEVLAAPNETIVMTNAPQITPLDDVTGWTGNSVGYSFTFDDSMIETKNVYKHVNDIHAELSHAFRSHDESNLMNFIVSGKLKPCDDCTMRKAKQTNTSKQLGLTKICWLMF